MTDESTRPRDLALLLLASGELAPRAVAGLGRGRAGGRPACGGRAGAGPVARRRATLARRSADPRREGGGAALAAGVRGPGAIPGRRGRGGAGGCGAAWPARS